ncbi:MAG TPA: hypothetical protein VNS61_15590 [Caldimonas sp.]|nr:hypothetical protein [Caldimonas sp.]
MKKTNSAAGAKRVVPMLAAAALSMSGAWAQTAPAASAPALPPPACLADEHRQFDFWIGDWEVFQPNGQKVGENRIEPIANGCALLENWSGRGGFSGKSLNIYDRDDKRWHQTWVDSSGSLLVIAGGLVDKRMVMSSQAPAPGGGTLQQRIAWTPDDDGSVRQLWESSTDSGKTWTVQFDGKYVRRK